MNVKDRGLNGAYLAALMVVLLLCTSMPAFGRSVSRSPRACGDHDWLGLHSCKDNVPWLRAAKGYHPCDYHGEERQAALNGDEAPEFDAANNRTEDWYKTDDWYDSEGAVDDWYGRADDEIDEILPP